MIDPARVRALAEEMEKDETIPPMTTTQAEQVVRILGPLTSMKDAQGGARLRHRVRATTCAPVPTLQPELHPRSAP